MKTVTTYILINSLIAILAISTFAFISLHRFHAAEVREEHENLEKCIRTFRELLAHKGKEFRIANGRLLVGDYVINGNFELPDKVQEIFGGVATVFQGNTRVSTNVLNDQGFRAVGTKLIGPAYDALFKEGKPYRGEAVILGVPYLTAYDPIMNSKGAIIGVLFVGVEKSVFLARFSGLRIQLILTLIGMVAAFTILMTLLGRVAMKYEQMNKEQLGFFQTVINTIPDPVFYKDIAGRYLGCNKAYELYAGLPQAEIIGKTIDQLWSSEQADIYRQMDQKLFENPGVQRFEIPIRFADWTQHDVVFNKATFQNKDGSLGGLVGVMLDITERKEAEKEKSLLEAQLHHSRMLELVMVQLGHDLKTPLTPLFALLPLIRERVSDPELKKMADICSRNAVQIKGLSDRTLKLAALSAIVAPSNWETIPLAPAVDEYLLDTLYLSALTNVSCENVIDPGIAVQGVADQLKELFANLISNAVRYSPEHGVIRISAEVTGKIVTVSVQDEGVGLAPEHIGRIFDEFFKVDESRHELASQGLGLAICKRIVLNHSGRIWAESPGIGMGTAIRFTLPRCMV